MRARSDRRDLRLGRPPAARVEVERSEPLAPRVMSITQAVFVNAVTIFGVFGLRWPVGTALALYWTETVLATVSLFLLLTLWRRIQGVARSGVREGELVGASFVFSAAHLVFLVVILAMILPRYAPAERFDRTSFAIGLIWIASLLFIDFAIHAIAIRYATEMDLQRRAELHMQRVGIMHLTIVFGMFALALFGTARALFAVFSGLKTLVDLTRRVR
jgi:hypothetical protein